MENMYEYAFSRAGEFRIDRSRGILHGVKVLGFYSRNGRRYTENCLSESVSLYENAKVNINHVESGEHPRDYRDRIGVLHGVQYRPDMGLFADFHYNPKHPLAEQLLWDAEHAPENVGFSHHVEAETSHDEQGVVVQKIMKVLGVDLVADPATTRGLFESQNETLVQSVSTQSDSTPLASTQLRLAASELDVEEREPESFEWATTHCGPYERRGLLECADLRLDGETNLLEGDEHGEETVLPMTDGALAKSCSLKSLSDEENSRGKRSYRSLRQRFEESEASRKRVEGELHLLRKEICRKDRELCIRELLQEQGLSIPLSDDAYGQLMVSEIFLKTLYEAEDEYTIRALILDRVRLMEQRRLSLREEPGELESVSHFIEEIKKN
ncbi:MAG: hypothetical protein PHE53_02415 [Thermoguttaceae bacterium]|nr:hypothetical protein [Thermoguttaceae bacterium]